MRFLYSTSLFIIFNLIQLNTCLNLKRDVIADEKTKQESSQDKNDHNHNKHHHHPIKHWGYRNQDRSLLPKNWHQTHPQCYGKQQSPINIESIVSNYDSSLKSLEIKSNFKNIDNNDSLSKQVEIWDVKNNGHSVVLHPLTKEFTFEIKPEKSKYKLLQMHFHWMGSEHYVDGHNFASELHLVHQNVDDEKKFAVLGFLFSLSNSDNVQLDPIIDVLPDIIKYGSKNTTEYLKLENLIPSKIESYFRYSGSLTTPDCDEIVEWFVIDNPVLTISNDQILDFQSVEDKNGYPIITNVRPVQELNDRSVRRSFEIKNSDLNARRKHVKSASGFTDIELDNRVKSFSYRVKSSMFLIGFILNFILFFF